MTVVCMWSWGRVGGLGSFPEEVACSVAVVPSVHLGR